MRPRRLTSKDKSPESSRNCRINESPPRVIKVVLVADRGDSTAALLWTGTEHEAVAYAGTSFSVMRLLLEVTFHLSSCERPQLAHWFPTSDLGRSILCHHGCPRLAFQAFVHISQEKLYNKHTNPREPPGLFHHVRRQMTAMCESGSRYSRDTYSWASESPEP